MATPVFAHGSHAGPLTWTLSPELVVPLALALIIYVIGWIRLSRRASTPVRPALFLSGWTVLTLSLTSPLH
jgi:cytochrome c oxidase assembly factor CtaG